MSQSFKLFRLQDIDSQIDRHRARLVEIETALRDDEAVRQAAARRQASETAFHTARLTLRKAEDEVTALRIKLETSEAALYGGRIRNPKELQDLQKEVEALKRHRTVLEDHQLEAMLANEEAESEHQVAQRALELAQAQSAVKHNDLHKEASQHQTELDHLQSERQAALPSIPADDLQLYEALRQQKRGIAVAKLAGTACGACGSVLNSALLSAVRSPSQLVRCERCGRILYAG